MEILTPEEWNRVVDALEELDRRASGGVAEIAGDGTTKTFSIPHGRGEAPTVVMVGKAAPGLPDIDYWTADDVNIYVTFVSPPAQGAAVRLWWMAASL